MQDAGPFILENDPKYKRELQIQRFQRICISCKRLSNDVYGIAVCINKRHLKVGGVYVNG